MGKDPITFRSQDPSLTSQWIAFHFPSHLGLINCISPSRHEGDFSLLFMAQWQQRPASFSPFRHSRSVRWSTETLRRKEMHILVSWTLHIVRRNCLFARQVTFFFQFHQLIKQKIALVFTSLYWLAYVKISGAKALFLRNFHSAKQTEDPVILKPAQLSRKTAVTSPFFSF